jgi:hypothetical protein
VPISNFLVGMRKGEYSRLAEPGSGDLQSYRHAICVEAAGHGNRGQTQHINTCLLRNSTGVPSDGRGGSRSPDSMLIGPIAVVGVTSKSTLENALSERVQYGIQSFDTSDKCLHKFDRRQGPAAQQSHGFHQRESHEFF